MCTANPEEEAKGRTRRGATVQGDPEGTVAHGGVPGKYRGALFIRCQPSGGLTPRSFFGKLRLGPPPLRMFRVGNHFSRPKLRPAA